MFYCYFLQHENHRSLPVSNEYTLDGLYPNTLYHVWLAAKSKRGEGAATPPIATRTEQYGKPPEKLPRFNNENDWKTLSPNYAN